MTRQRVRRFGTRVLVVSVIAATGWAAPRTEAQALMPATFEVASVKANALPDGPRGILVDKGRFTATGLLLVDLIRYAYGLNTIDQSSQVIGGPPWIRIDRFDIVATAEGQPTLPMLKALLEDPFKVVVRVERRDAPVYALVLDRQDGRLGRAIHQSTSECQAQV